MRTLIITLIISTFSLAQENQYKEEKQVVIDFFDAFHKQDSTRLNNMAHKEILMQRIQKKEGQAVLTSSNYNDFVKSIVSIPENVKFHEKLLAIRVESDKLLANVWTPYEFYINGKLSHSGVNAFQLINTQDGWKVIKLIDTVH